MRISDWSSDVCSSDLFDANVASGLPWRFTAPKPVKLRLGEERLVAYKGKNIGNGPYLGTATFNVTPFKTGEYFSKIECFCFTEQLLLPGEKKEFTVSFFVDPKLAEEIGRASCRERVCQYV